MPAIQHILVNGLSIGSGGGYTVGKGLLVYLALARPAWRFTIVVTEGVSLHEEFRREKLPANCGVLWAPPNTTKVRDRARYENSELVEWCKANSVTAVLQLNAMLVKNLRLPTICHNQDPMPYRPEAWESFRDRIVAIFKRRAQGRGMKHAAYVGWTSHYLRKLMCDHFGFTPQRGAVFYNGIADEWIERAERALPPLETRPLEIVTVSNVAPFKQQHMVIRAMPQIIRTPGLEKLVYRVVGAIQPHYRDELAALAKSLGVGDHVILEGRVPEERVQQAFQQARCYVLMSLCESFGIPAIEAMSFGTPVVTSDCCAMPEVCGQAAELCPPDQVDELARRIIRVLTDKEHAETMRQEGAKQVRKFNWSETAEQMARAFEEITAKVADSHAA